MITVEPGGAAISKLGAEDAKGGLRGFNTGFVQAHKLEMHKFGEDK